MGPVDVSYVRELCEEDVESRQYSTLDLCSFDAFTLIVAINESWSSRFDIAAGLLRAKNIKLELWAADSGFTIVEEEHRELFCKSVLGNGGALLVRPDQHILAYFDAQAKAEDVEQIVKAYLGL